MSLKSGQKLNNKGRQNVPSGEVVVMDMPGGGGLGDPLSRSPERVAWDVKNGMVSAEAARDAYKVVVSGTGELDAAATKKLRA